MSVYASHTARPGVLHSLKTKKNVDNFVIFASYQHFVDNLFNNLLLIRDRKPLDFVILQDVKMELVG